MSKSTTSEGHDAVQCESQRTQKPAQRPKQRRQRHNRRSQWLHQLIKLDKVEDDMIVRVGQDDARRSRVDFANLDSDDRSATSLADEQPS